MGLVDYMTTCWYSVKSTVYNLPVYQQVTGLVAVCAVSVHVYIRWVRRRSSPPGPVDHPPDHPSSGTRKKAHVLFHELRQQKGDVFTVNVGGSPTVVINGRLIYEALSKFGDAFSGRPKLSKQSCSPSSQTTLTFGTFDTSWVLHKEIASSALASFVTNDNLLESIIKQETVNLVNDFVKQNGKCFNPKSLILTAVTSIMFQVCYGKNKTLRTDADFCCLIKDREKLPGSGGTNSGMNRAEAKQKLQDIRTVIDNGVALRGRLLKQHVDSFNEEHMRDVLDCLIKSTKHLSEQDKQLGVTEARVVGTVGDLFAGGVDSVSSTVTWSLLLLTVHQHVQARIQGELDAVVGSDRMPSLRDRTNLPYLQASVLEVLRFACVMPLSIPHTTTRDVRLAGHSIHRGARVLINLFSLTHDVDVWGDPGVFRPERFLTNTGHVNTQRVATFLPFSAGARRCLGESLAESEIYLILSGLLHRCRLIRNPDVASYNLEPVSGATQDPLPYTLHVTTRC